MSVRCLTLSYHCCCRVIKQALAMLGKVEGMDFIYMQTTVANRDMINVLPNMTYYDNPEMLVAKLKGLKGVVDIVHCHNEPDWMGPVVKEVLPDVPLVYDVHDLASMRDFPLDVLIDQEKRAMLAADAYVFPSYGYERDAREFHDIPKSKPSMVLYSYCFEQALSFEKFPRLRGIVYEGNLSGEFNPKMAYRNHLYLAEFCKIHNIPLAVYGGDNGVHQMYIKQAAMCFTSVPYPKLISNLSRYDWGFVGHAEYTKTLEYCMPNKMFEYVTAGIPVIVCNAPEAGKWAEDNGVGVSISSVHEIPEIYHRHEELRKNVEEKNKAFTMESQIPDLLGLYEKVLNGK